MGLKTKLEAMEEFPALEVPRWHVLFYDLLPCSKIILRGTNLVPASFVLKYLASNRSMAFRGLAFENVKILTLLLQGICQKCTSCLWFQWDHVDRQQAPFLACQRLKVIFRLLHPFFLQPLYMNWPYVTVFWTFLVSVTWMQPSID